jgi:DNA polymerase-1
VPSERAVFVDGTGLLYRAFHALPQNLKTTSGEPTNALFGFAQMFRKVLSGRRPTFGAVVFDAGKGTFRTAIDPTYKAERPAMEDALRAQLVHLEGLVDAHGFRAISVPGFEADDVIATLTTRALELGHEVWVVSSDKDLLQLVGPDVRVLDSVKEVLYDAETVYRRFGVRPERLPDLQALVGDPIDGIPGVPGIGAKTAAQLLSTSVDLASVLAAAEHQPGRTGSLLRKHREQAERSLLLSTLRRDVPLPVTLDELHVTFPSPEALDEVYLRLEFYSLLSPQAVSRVRPTGAVQYFVCDTPEQARRALAAESAGPDAVAIHVLIDLPDHLRGDLVGIALSPSLGRGVYFPFAGVGVHLGAEGLELLRSWLEDPARPKILHECKQGLVALARHGVELRGIVGDSALASYLVDMTKHLPHRIEQVAREYLHVGLQPLRGVIGTGRDRRTFSSLTVDRAGAWACHVADATGAAWRTLEPRIRTEGLSSLLFDLDLPLSTVLARMELAGIAMDPTVLERAGRRLAAERSALRDRIEALVGHPFNPGSHKQLGTVLYEELALPVKKRTKTGWSVDAEVLEQLAELHPVVDLVLRWRTVDKLIHTYTEVLQAAIGPDGRIHPTYQQTVASSSRLITTEPDLQRTPVRTDEFRELREAFVAAAGTQLVSADWSQVELRLLAHITEDAALRHAFLHDLDVHRETAAALFSVPPEQVDPRQREIGKTVNFATIYGQGAAALARQLGIPTAEARQHILTFFEKYQGVARWRDAVVAKAYEDGFVTTLLGRRRYLPELFANDPTDRSYGERIAVNTPIQGSGADLCKVAMLHIDRALRDARLAARMVLQIHDEILLEVPDAEVDAVVALVRSHMETAVPLAVPLRVDVGVGRTWAAAH